METISRKIKINGAELFYEESGSGEPLILIHGLGSSTFDWRSQIRFFDKHFRTIALDLRGHGQSEKSPDIIKSIKVSQFADDVIGLMQELKIKSAHIVGISMGGAVAFELAVKYPERVSCLVLCNTLPSFIPVGIKAKLQIQLRLIIANLFGMGVLGKILAKKLFPKENQEQFRMGFMKRWAENNKYAWMQSMRALSQWSVEEKLPEIKCPALVVASDEDYWPVNVKKAYTLKMANGMLYIVNDSRHAVTADQPEIFNKNVLNFLQS